MGLAEKKCIPCSGGISPLTLENVTALAKELDNWQIPDGMRLIKSYKLDNFKQAMTLADKIADIAESENHHPDLLVRWGELKIELWTHKINGLTESDFILAAKIDKCASAFLATKR